MIKYHPSDALLQAHAAGELPLSLSTAVSAHCEMCHQCQLKVNEMNSRFASEVFHCPPVTETELEHFDSQAMLAQIMTMPEANPPQPEDVILDVQGKSYQLPRVFKRQLQQHWSGIGKISRMRFDGEESKARSSLLHIEAGGEIPPHTHKGQEITLLLAGDFCDEYSDYHPGDFIVMSSEHEHTPKTRNGCLCYTVVDAPLYFTKGISKLLNPLGELIY